MHVCDIDEAGDERLGPERPPPWAARSLRPSPTERGSGGLFGRRQGWARRARRPREQCGHRRAAAEPVDKIDPAEWDRASTSALTPPGSTAPALPWSLKKRTTPPSSACSSAAGKLGFALRTPYAAAQSGASSASRSRSRWSSALSASSPTPSLPGVRGGERIQGCSRGRRAPQISPSRRWRLRPFRALSIAHQVRRRQLADQSFSCARRAAGRFSGRRCRSAGHPDARLGGCAGPAGAPASEPAEGREGSVAPRFFPPATFPAHSAGCSSDVRKGRYGPPQSARAARRRLTAGPEARGRDAMNRLFVARSRSPRSSPHPPLPSSARRSLHRSRSATSWADIPSDPVRADRPRHA